MTVEQAVTLAGFIYIVIYGIAHVASRVSLPTREDLNE